MHPSGLSDLRNLSNLISEAVGRIEQALTTRSVDFPSLDSQHYSEEEEDIRSVPEVADAIVNIVAAAEQIATVVRPPSLTILDISFKFHLCAALRVALEADVTEFLREHGPSHVEAIAKQRNLDPSKLATNHIFREVTPDVFANTRLSSSLDSGRSCAELITDPSAKLVPFPAFVSFALDFCFKAAAQLPDVLLSPATSHSVNLNETAFAKVANMDGTFFEYLDLPGNEHMREKFGAAMTGLTQRSHPESILEVFDWTSLPAGSIVVDVGGGIGSQMVTLARSYPSLKLVVQDREAVCADAMKYTKKVLPSAVESGQIQVQAHDIFTPQPIQDASVYYLRHVAHNWSDSTTETLLKRLRDADW
ncbi:unnamed protein product [Peniophora sp. CBMAI 1063]|nr:unnamed protein product [Peniophora sp. CBMAI 1063]